jgi:hypothetical protein
MCPISVFSAAGETAYRRPLGSDGLAAKRLMLRQADPFL